MPYIPFEHHTLVPGESYNFKSVAGNTGIKLVFVSLDVVAATTADGTHMEPQIADETKSYYVFKSADGKMHKTPLTKKSSPFIIFIDDLYVGTFGEAAPTPEIPYAIVIQQIINKLLGTKGSGDLKSTTDALVTEIGMYPHFVSAPVFVIGDYELRLVKNKPAKKFS